MSLLIEKDMFVVIQKNGGRAFPSPENSHSGVSLWNYLRMARASIHSSISCSHQKHRPPM
jgi:hypothetical protein